MKKICASLILLTMSFADARSTTNGSATASLITAAAKTSKAMSTHYIINLTGRTIILNFYQKSIFTGESTFYDSSIFGPLAWTGKSTTNIFDTLNMQLVPSPIDMHTNSCFKVTVDAFSLTDSKLKDPSISGTSMPTPATSPTPNDIMITLEGKQLVITQLDTCMGIKIPGGSRKQWPSEEDVRISNMTQQEKLTSLLAQNEHLNGDISDLERAIRKTSNLVKKNNRKKMIANKKELIKKNEKTIVKLQAEIAAAPKS